MLKGLTVAYLIHDSFKVEAGHKSIPCNKGVGGAGQWLNALGAKVIGTAGGADKCAG